MTKLELLKQEKGWSYLRLAEEADMAESTVAQIVPRGRQGKGCRHESAYMIATALGTTVDDLFIKAIENRVESYLPKEC